MARSNSKKKRWILFSGVVALLAIVAVAAIFGRAWLRDREARNARAEAMVAYEAREYERALDLFSTALARHRNDVEALLAFADTRFHVPEENGQHITSALGLYAHALDLEPRNPDALNGLLDIYSVIREFRRPELESTATRVLEIEPDNRKALEARMWCAARVGEFDRAVADAQRVCELAPAELNARKTLVALMSEAGHELSALLQECDRYIAATESIDGRGKLLKAMVLASGDRGTEAEGTLLESIDEGVSVETLSDTLAMLDARRNRDESNALADGIVAELKATKDPQVYEILVRRHWQRGALQDASEEAEEGRTLAAHSLALTRWGALLAVTSNAESAHERVAEYEHLLDQEVNVALQDAAWRQALRALVDDDFSLSARIGELTAARQQLPNDPVLTFLTADAYMTAGEWERANHLLEEAHRQDPYWVTAANAHAESLLRLGRAGRAYTLARENVARYRLSTLQPYLTLLRAWIAVDRRFGTEPVDALPPFRAMPSSDVYAEYLYDETKHPPLVPYVLEAFSIHDRQADTTAIVDELLTSADQEVEAGTLLRIASVAANYKLEVFERTANAAEAAGADSIELAQLRATYLLNREQPEDAWTALQAATASNEAGTHRLNLIRLQFAAMCGRPAADHLAIFSELAADTALTAPEAAYLLSTDIAWTDNAKATTAALVERLSTMLGERSIRARLMEARYVLEFQAESPQLLAGATNKVDTILKEVPDSLTALVLMSRLLREGEVPAPVAAAEVLQKAVDLYPEREELYPELIALFQQIAYYGDAEEYLSRLSILRARKDESIVREAQLLITQGDYAEALNRLVPLTDSSELYEQLSLAQLALRAGNGARVEAFLTDFRESGISDPLYVDFGTVYLVSRGRVDEAKALLEAAEPQVSPSDHAILRASFFKQTQQHATAADLLKQAVELDPESITAILALATNHLLAHEAQQAVDVALQGLQRFPDQRELQVVVASASLALSPAKRREAIRTFASLEGVDEGLVRTLKVFDQAVDENGKLHPTPELLRDIGRITTDHPTLLPAWQLAVSMNEAAGDMPNAKRMAREAMRRLRTRPEPAKWYFQFLFRDGELFEAIAVARDWRARSLRDPYEPDLAIATTQLRLREYDKALQALEPHSRRLELDRSLTAFDLWISTLIFARQGSRAYALLEADLPTDDEVFHTWVDACIQLTATNPDEAETLLVMVQPFAQANPNRSLAYALGWSHIGYMQDDPSHFPMAREIVNAIAANDDEMRVQVNRALALIETNAQDHARAADLYREILAIKPNDALALNNLAYALAEDLNQAEEAVQFSQQLVDDAEFGRIPQFVDTHALVLLRVGRLDEARSTIDSVIAQNPDVPDFRLTRARIAHAARDMETVTSDLSAIDRLIQRDPAAYHDLQQALNQFRRSISAASAGIPVP